MKKRNYAVAAALALLPVLAALVLSAGCEATSPDEMSVTVTPDYAKLKSGQSVTMTASGWFSYRWSLKNPEYGYLSSTVGERVSYRATTASSLIITTALPENYTTTKPLGGATNEYTKRVHKQVGDSRYSIDTYVYTALGSENGEVIKGNLDTPTTHEIKDLTASAEEIKQIITVQATGSIGGTNTSYIAAGQVTIIQQN